MPNAETKDAIFRSYLPIQEADAETGRILLARLGELAPNIADRFDVRDDLLGEFTLRLINETNVDIEKVDDVRSYVALSYCWDERFKDKWRGNMERNLLFHLALW